MKKLHVKNIIKKILLAFLIHLFLANPVYGQSAKIELDRHVLDLDYFLGNGAKTEIVRIKNIGDEALVINKIRPSCDCIEAHVNKSILTKNESVELAIILNLDSEEFNGLFTKYVYVQSNDPNQPVTRITLKGTALRNPRPDGKIEILFFYSQGCRGCEAIKNGLLPGIKDTFKDKIMIGEYEISDAANYAKLIEFENKHHIYKSVPMELFVANTYLLGKSDIENNLERIVGILLHQKTTPHTQQTSGLHGKDLIKERFKSFSVFAVLGAGLVDGFNPCAFATIIFLISFLTCTGRSKKEILAIGVFFGLAVFLTYMAIGLGLFKGIQALGIFTSLSKIIYLLAIIFSFLLGIFSLYDSIAYMRSKKAEDIKLKLPDRIKDKIHHLITHNLRTGGLILTVLITGFLVSLLESICTGQLYLPAIVFMTKNPALRTRAYFYFVIYNIMFILPLIVVTICAYAGTSIDNFIKFSKINVIISKMALAFIFFALGFLMLLYI